MPLSSSEIWLALIVGTTTIVILGSILFGSILYSQRRHINAQREKVRILEESEHQLKESYVQQRKLSAHLQSVREEERTTIAREIHDELGQLLTVMKMDIAFLRRKIQSLQPSEDSQHLISDLNSMSELADKTIHSVRRIATELRPEILDELGLIEAIEWEAQVFEKRTGIKSDFMTNIQKVDIDRERATAVFRIFQETLTNVARHANASSVVTRLENQNGNLVIQIKDNGRGITNAEVAGTKSFGLLGMKERALIIGGDVNIIGESGKGTTVTLSVPIV